MANKYPLVIYYCLDCGADMVVRQYSVRRYCGRCVTRRERLSPGRPKGNVEAARAMLPAQVAARVKINDSQSIGGQVEKEGKSVDCQ